MTIEPDTLANDPIVQLGQWLRDAVDAGCRDPNAACLSTIGDGNMPDARIVLLKEITTNGIVFFTNYNSAKGQQLATNPKAAMTFFWSQLERQVRVSGTVSKIDPRASDEYFMSRPLESRAGAWLSPQSSEVTQKWIDKARQAIAGGDHAGCNSRPPFWGGYELIPQWVEFWQGGAYRMHDRFRYDRSPQGWQIKRLAP